MSVSGGLLKKAILIVALVLGTVAVLWLLKPGPAAVVSPPQAAAPLVPPGVAVPQMPSPRMQALQQSPREPFQPKPADNLSPECVGLWNSLRAMNLSDAFAFPPKAEVALPEGSRCAEMPPVLLVAHQKYLQDCKDVKEKYRPGMQAMEFANSVAQCFLAASIYRATIGDWLTRDKSLNEITDPKELSDKIAARVFTDPGSAADAADRLLELEPDLYPAAKIAAVSRFMEAQSKAGADPQSELWNKAQDARDRAGKMDPNDPDMTEMELAEEMLKAKDARGMRNRLESLRERNPDLSDYYMSCLEHKTGNSPAAIKILQDMQARRSPEPRVGPTLQKIQAGEKQACQTQVSFPVDAVGTPPTPKS